ncbi:MAG: LppP/LprE family lipoprotein [Chloroflexi bacterium]|nr:LppP/LprE family lipoprotein [Chloroflexota bacterium]
MRAGLSIVVALATALLAWVPPSPALADGSWLDSPPANWNNAGMDIPAPDPAYAAAGGPQCATLVPRPAATDADTALTDAGWTLFSSYLGGWNTTIVRGLSGYDGMCRPMGYNAFVFVDGQFAGTISPTAMDSRTDGAGDVRYFASKDTLVAEFQRYGPDDPLCCPSNTTDVTYQISRTPAGPVLVPHQS